MTNFREVRERVTAEDAARRYGLDVDRHGKALCPFHADRHPSMSFKNGYYRCRVCNVGGDSIDLTARLLELTPLEAVKRLNTDFALGLPIDAPPTKAERLEAQKWRLDAETYQNFQKWRAQTVTRLNECFRLAFLALKYVSPDFWTNPMVDAVRYQPAVEWWSDALTSGNISKQMEIFRARKEVERICTTILGPLQMKCVTD